MPRVQRHLTILGPACLLALGAAGLLSSGLASAESVRGGAVVPPGPRQREARAVLPAPRQRTFALPATGSGPFDRRHVSHTRAAETALPDFSGYHDVNQKKLQFFSFLLPVVEAENRRLLELRERLEYIHDHVRWGRGIDDEDRAWLAAVQEEFRLTDMDPGSSTFWRTLLKRVDILPEELVLVQAANESAWGTSRFAREGNNLFGQWCLEAGCGIVPAERPEGENYEVARFASVDASVGSYMRNINTGRPYRNLRNIRARDRGAGRDPEAETLADGLHHYSERGDDYVDEIRSMLRYNAPVIEEARQRILATGATS